MPPAPDDDRSNEHELRSFGRKRGRKLSLRQETLLRELLPQVSLDLGGAAASALGLRPEPFDEVWLEIGFGGGEHLLWQAAHNRNVLLIGCEPFVDGVVKVLSAIAAEAHSNLRLHADDARPLLRWLPRAVIGRCFVLFPDPWPKRRHAKRRLVSPTLLSELARVMRAGAELRVATDIGDYARTVLLAAAASPHFQWTATAARDWRERPSDWPPTRYEAKAIRDGRRCYFLAFRRTDRD